MPPSTNRTGGRLRRILLLAVVAGVAAGAYACRELGAFLYSEDPLRSADAICVLAGTRMERPLEAADLYLERWAPRIVLTEDVPDKGIVALQLRGLRFPTNAQIARDVIIRLGVPEGAVEVLPGIHDSTAAEANTFRRLALARRWQRLIVVTSKFHTRRTAFALRRELKGSGVEVVIRGSRYDTSDPEHWWRTRADVRWAASEVQKLVAYGLGLGL